MDFLLFFIKYFLITVSFPRFSFAQFCHVFSLVEFQFVFTSLNDEGTKQPGGSYQLHHLHHVNNGTTNTHGSRTSNTRYNQSTFRGNGSLAYRYGRLRRVTERYF